MTPEKAIDILEGRIPHPRPIRRVNPHKETAIEQPNPGGEKKSYFLYVIAAVLIVGLLLVLHLWRVASVSEGFYKKGFNDGVASMSKNLTLAQQNISDEVRFMDELQRDLGKSKENIVQLQSEMDRSRQDLEVVSRQKEELAQDFKDSEASIPMKINAVEQPLNQKITDLTQQVANLQGQLEQKDNQLNFLQKAISQVEGERDEAKQISDQREQKLMMVQKDLDDKVGKLNALRQDLSQSKNQLTKLQQEINKSTEDLLVPQSSISGMLKPPLRFFKKIDYSRLQLSIA